MLLLRRSQLLPRRSRLRLPPLLPTMSDTRWLSDSRRMKTSPDGTLMSFSRARCLTTMTSPVVTFSALGLSPSGKPSRTGLTTRSRSSVFRTATSPCSSLVLGLRKRRTTLKVSLPKLLGLPRLVLPTLRSTLLSGPLPKPSCTLTTPSGSTLTETSRSSSTNGTLSSDGNSRTLNLSSVPENSSGKKATPPSSTRPMLTRKSSTFLSSTERSTRISSLCPSSPVKSPRRKSLPVVITLPLWKVSSPPPAEVSRPLLPTTWDKTSPRCLTLPSSLQTSPKVDCTRIKTLGVSPHVRWVSWSWSTVMTKVSSCPLGSPFNKSRLSLLG
ncbi:hypothetical protein I352_04900 [Cryptococcus deuterogattii MMRL2647]|nr:hypothetical protein I352_04900 [Cryptococcus deuterogattii MMRL2647]